MTMNSVIISLIVFVCGRFYVRHGANMINKVCLLADTDCERVSAFMNSRQRSVDVVCAVAGRLTNGALMTLNATGDGPPGCSSQITFFYTEAIVRIDAWGAWREIATAEAPGLREEVRRIR
jgi:hypothetical protein